MDPVQKRFVKIIETYGYATASDSRWFRALLRDLLCGTAPQVHALADAALDGIPIELSKLANDPHAKLRTAQLQTRLRDDRGWEFELAKWTIESWAAALQSSTENGKSFSLKCPACRNKVQISGRSIGQVVQCADDSCGVRLRVYSEGREAVVEPCDDKKKSAAIVVAADGTGQFTSLAEAVAAVEEGAELLLKGSTFEASLVITKSLTILGDNQPSQVVIQSQNGSCFLIKSGTLRIVNLSIKTPASLTGARKPVLELAGGEIDAEHCLFESKVAQAVSVRGRESSATFRHCAFIAEKGDGVAVWSGATAVLLDCSIKGTRSIGVSVDNEADVKLLGCHVENSKYLGVKSRNSKLLMEQCHIHHALQTGVEISGGTFALIQSGITVNGGRGVWVHDKAGGRIHGCDLRGNRTGGASVSPDCQVTLEENQLD